MGKRSQNIALQVLVPQSESVLWTGVLVQTTMFAEVQLRFKVRALLTQNAVIWSSLRDLDHPIRIEYPEMLEPQVSLTGIVGHFRFSISALDDDTTMWAGRKIESLVIYFGGIPSSFIDCLVDRVPNLELQSPVLQRRYS
jgi:hypothetical protein